ncbi:MAG: L-threonine ammonia-lyase [Nocardioides sp.]|nr:L-threonine ammonia-lyase [Nocardioides sp.]
MSPEPPGGDGLPALADIRAARELLGAESVRTPMEESRWLSGLAGGEVLLKAENLQRTGSFKFRGAYVRVARLTPAERARGVVAASAGNHAQGVALSARLLGANATVFMPEGAQIPKVRATRAYGADVRFHGRDLGEALVAATEFASRTGAVLVHPYDHFDILAGQGTCGLEILEQCPGVRTIMVATGGGGLVAGIALAVKSLVPEVKVVGVQAEGASSYLPSLAAGRPLPLKSMSTMADGIAVGCPGRLPFRAVQNLVDEIVTVSERSLSRALLMLLERAKLVVEPAGAAAVAALMDSPESFETPAVVVLSGGNVDPVLLGKVIRQGMSAAGRHLSCRVRIPDTPGGLATLLGVVAGCGANVLDLAHDRGRPALGLDEVEVDIQLETRGASHTLEILEGLGQRGYGVVSADDSA